jgi:hypothetical protein
MVEWVSRGLDVLCFDANKNIVKQSIQVTYYQNNTVLATTQYTTRGANESYLMPVAKGTDTITFNNPYLIDCSNNGGAKVERIEGGWKISGGRKIIDPTTMSGFSVYFTYSEEKPTTTTTTTTPTTTTPTTTTPTVTISSGGGGVTTTTTITTPTTTTEEKGVFEIIKPYLPYILVGLAILFILAIVLDKGAK